MSRKGWKGAIVFLRPRPAAPSPPTRPTRAPVRGWPAAAAGQVWRKIEGVQRSAVPSPPTRPVWTPVRGRTAVTAGQVWCKMDAVPTLWEVDGLVADLLGLSHVRLRLKDDPTTTKLIAARSLQDTRVYRLVRTADAD